MALPAFAFLKAPLNTSSSVTTLDELKQRIQNNDESVETTFNELGVFFDTHPNAFQQSRFFNLKSYKHILEQDLVAGYETLLEARKLAKKGGNTMALAESFRLEGLILDLSGEHALALEALNKSLAAFIEVNSDNALLVYSAMGNLYMSLQNYEMMLQLGRNYLAAAQRLGDKENKAIAYFFQGFAQTELGDYQYAKISLLLAEELFKEVHYPFIGIVHTKMAELYIAQGNLTEALTMLNRAAESDRKVGFKYNEGSRLLRLVDIYIKRNQIDLAISELEGGLKIIKIVKLLVKNKIPVLGHLGILPQSTMGKFKSKGKSTKERKEIIRDSKLLQEAGAFSLVLECVEKKLSKEITNSLKIPTIGIGSSNNCDGQILVTDDILGLTDSKIKFVKKFANIKKIIASGVKKFKKEVKSNKYPTKKYSY